MKISLATFLLTSALLLTGCISPSTHQGSSSPYMADMDQIIEKSKGTRAETAVLSILSDNIVTEAEMLDRAQAQNSCMHEAGFPGYDADPLKGGIKYGTIDDEKIEEIYREEKKCERRTFALEIGSLYFAMIRNPKKISEPELMAACLVKTGVVSPSYSGVDYQKSMEIHQHKYENAVDEGHQEPAYAVPYIVDEERGKEAFWRCSREPQKILYEDGELK